MGSSGMRHLCLPEIFCTYTFLRKIKNFLNRKRKYKRDNHNRHIGHNRLPKNKIKKDTIEKIPDGI